MSQAGNAGDESERKVSLSLSGLYIGFFFGGDLRKAIFAGATCIKAE